jgi:SAM-dependent methyltransferase
MRLRERLARAYFDAVYNPLYDSTTARLTRYSEALAKLSHRLRLEPGQRILCVGLGTGNELLALRAREARIGLVGIDVSLSALRRARQKARGHSAGAALARMDGELLGFRDDAFDRVLCYHVLDFVSAPGRMAAELLRVLKPGGRFVISLPAGGEGVGLGAALMRHNLARGVMAGLIYLPLTLRRKPIVFTQEDATALLGSLGAADLVIEADQVYRDHLACGVKKKGGRDET